VLGIGVGIRTQSGAEDGDDLTGLWVHLTIVDGSVVDFETGAARPPQPPVVEEGALRLSRDLATASTIWP
jgi:hypothetical protein